MKRARLPCCLAGFLLLLSPLRAAPRQVLTGHVPEVTRSLAATGGLDPRRQLHLALQLPLRHEAELAGFLQRLYDPASADYKKYLTEAQFVAAYGPLASDYEAVRTFAVSNGLQVTARHPSRILLDVRGSVADVERAFQIHLRTYQHPTEARSFFAPDVEPTIDLRLPTLHIHGLSDFAVMRPMARRALGSALGFSASGSGPMGNYLGPDFTNAYVPGVSWNGSGQMIGLFEADGFYPADIAAYEKLAGLPNVPITVVTNDGFNGAPGGDNQEVALDLEMAVSMAPGLAGVVVYEGPNNPSDWIDILDNMASSNQIKQFSSSWGYTGSPDPNTNFDAEFQKMAAQGQSFFQASGDGDAWVNPIFVPADSPYVTSVGGTTLTMINSGTVYLSETVWNSGNLGADEAWGPNGNGWWGSGGGVSTVYPIPAWQQGINMAANGGSTNMRNIPDVAMVASGVWVIYNNGESNSFIGTSAGAPLWAGIVARANQQAAAYGKPSVGFANPALYAIGQSGNGGVCFHDITNGNNTNAQSHNLYPASAGYDLATGWGTPNGSALINALAPPDTLVVTPSGAEAFTGGAGGPFIPSSQTYILTNGGAAALSWVAGSAAPWLNISPASGSLNPGGPSVAVVLSLTAFASNEMVGVYGGSIFFTNVTDGVGQTRGVTLNVVAPPVFTLLPVSQTEFSGASVLLTALASSNQPVSYQWQQNGTNLMDGAGISGSSTTALSINNLSSTNAGAYTVVASNAGGITTSAPPAILTVVNSPQLVQNGGFETGSFSGWTLSGNVGFGQDSVVNTPNFVHTGSYGAELGSSGSLGYLSQNLATTPGQLYELSLWLKNPGAGGGTPNQFLVTWNGATLFNQTNLPQLAWTNLQFSVGSSSTNTVLQLGFRDDPAYLGLDDISVVPLRANLQNIQLTGGSLVFSWIALSNAVYQVQSATNLTQTNWTAVGNPLTATNPVLSGNYPVNTNTATFYRVVLVP
jgi:subtilase family serine protease